MENLIEEGKVDAGSHCGIGNMKLILDTMVSWMNLTDKHID